MAFWLEGSAGSEKSSVTTSFAEMVEDDDEFDLTCFSANVMIQTYQNLFGSFRRWRTTFLDTMPAIAQL